MCDTKQFLCGLNVEELSEHLVEKGVHEDVSATFKSNRIGGKVFLKLPDENLKELIPTVGEKALVKELLEEIDYYQCQVA